MIQCQPVHQASRLWVVVAGQKVPHSADAAKYDRAEVIYRIGEITYNDSIEFDYHTDDGFYVLIFSPETIIEKFFSRTGDEFIVKSGLPGLRETAIFNLRDMEYDAAPILEYCGYYDPDLDW